VFYSIKVRFVPERLTIKGAVMKKIAIVVAAFFIVVSLALAQTYNKTTLDDQTQEEKNLEILSKKLVRMKKEMDKFIKDMSATYQGPDSAFTKAFGSDVKVDIVENDKGFIVTADLPGMDKDKIDVTLESGKILKISGTRHAETTTEAPGVVKQERMEGKFERVVELPAECKSDGISASYKNGVLEITIPKKESTKVAAVKVKVQ